MVSLYKDPGGKNIVLTTGEKESNSTSLGTANGMEMKKLQKRITELEISLQQHVSSLYNINEFFQAITMNIQRNSNHTHRPS